MPMTYVLYINSLEGSKLLTAVSHHWHCSSAGSIYRSIAILVQYRYLVVSRYFDIFGIERPLFDTFDIESIRDSTTSMRRRNIVVDDIVVYRNYHFAG